MKKQFACYLDVDENHPSLYGQCLLPRDEDGMGFALGLQRFKGRYCMITVEMIDDTLPLPDC